MSPDATDDAAPRQRRPLKRRRMHEDLVEILACDAKRSLAVDVHQAEHEDQDAWLSAIAPARPLWRRLLSFGR